MVLKTSAGAPITCSDWDDLCDVDGFLALGRNRYHCAYVVYTDGTYFYAENGTTGNLDYGGPTNEGLVTGTDARDVIQAAVNAPGTGGGKVYIKSGTYILDGPITLPNFIGVYGPFSRRATEIGVNLLCGAVLQLTDNTNDNIFENANPSPTGNVGIEINGLYLDMGTQTTGEAINWSNVWRSKISNCFIRGAGTTDRRGIYLRQACEQDWITGIHIDGAGITVDNSGAIYIDDFETGGAIRGVELTSTAYGNHVNRGYIYLTSGSGIFAHRQLELEIHECLISDADYHGIQLNYGIVNSVISDNICVNNSQDTANTYDGITLDSGSLTYPSTGNIITNNRCHDREAVVGNKTQRYGISITSSAAVDLTDENFISANHVFGNRTGGINITAAVGPDNTIDRNMGYNPVGNIATPFDTPNTRLEVTGVAATPTASTDYVVCHMPLKISSTDSGSTDCAIMLKDPAGANVLQATLSTIDHMYVPRNFQLNWGAFTGAAPTVTASFV